MTSIESWINDELYDILGISDRVISKFLLDMAKSSCNASEFIDKIKETNTIDIDHNVVDFAQTLIDKLATFKKQNNYKPSINEDHYSINIQYPSNKILLDHFDDNIDNDHFDIQGSQKKKFKSLEDNVTARQKIYRKWTQENEDMEEEKDLTQNLSEDIDKSDLDTDDDVLSNIE
ncbi:unnamed protein product [Gordionus sp. m RMFG-2023]|uniref:pre-mRNA-splicing factor ATP-dependent RNA helicase DHX16-like n=1 Tax=Gordionus sp. m RMFG-2023 TaxID=3053472 RepID=UPI0030DDF857